MSNGDVIAGAILGIFNNVFILILAAIFLIFHRKEIILTFNNLRNGETDNTVPLSSRVHPEEHRLESVKVEPNRSRFSVSQTKRNAAFVDAERPTVIHQHHNEIECEHETIIVPLEERISEATLNMEESENVAQSSSVAHVHTENLKTVSRDSKTSYEAFMDEVFLNEPSTKLQVFMTDNTEAVYSSGESDISHVGIQYDTLPYTYDMPPVNLYDVVDDQQYAYDSADSLDDTIIEVVQDSDIHESNFADFTERLHHTDDLPHIRFSEVFSADILDKMSANAHRDWFSPYQESFKHFSIVTESPTFETHIHLGASYDSPPDQTAYDNILTYTPDLPEHPISDSVHLFHHKSYGLDEHVDKYFHDALHAHAADEHIIETSPYQPIHGFVDISANELQTRSENTPLPIDHTRSSSGGSVDECYIDSSMYKRTDSNLDSIESFGGFVSDYYTHVEDLLSRYGQVMFEGPLSSVQVPEQTSITKKKIDTSQDNKTSLVLEPIMEHSHEEESSIYSSSTTIHGKQLEKSDDNHTHIQQSLEQSPVIIKSDNYHDISTDNKSETTKSIHISTVTSSSVHQESDSHISNIPALSSVDTINTLTKRNALIRSEHQSFDNDMSYTSGLYDSTVEVHTSTSHNANSSDDDDFDPNYKLNLINQYDSYTASHNRSDYEPSSSDIFEWHSEALDSFER